MATNLAIDDQLIIDAVNAGHHKSKKEAVTAALKEYIQSQKQREIISLFGTIDYASDYSYKEERRKE
jgi:metal-responsive CopG/Arc/MetJ family transcriptional regulator